MIVVPCLWFLLLGLFSPLALTLVPQACFLELLQFLPDLLNLLFRLLQRPGIVDDVVGVGPLFIDGKLGSKDALGPFQEIPSLSMSRWIWVSGEM
jgi:hypothetical protein